jgi:hypothetical protein
MIGTRQPFPDITWPACEGIPITADVELMREKRTGQKPKENATATTFDQK